MTEEPKPQPAPPEDSRTDSGTAEGYARRIERLFHEHNDSLLRFLSVRLGSRQEAREIAQEAYVRLLKLDTPGAVSYLRAFLFRTAANLAIDRIRTRSYRERSATLDFFEKVPAYVTPEREVGGAQELLEVARLLSELPPKCRYAFVMSRFHGMDAAEIAKDMNVTDTMVRRYITRALIHCRAGLDAATGSSNARE